MEPEGSWYWFDGLAGVNPSFDREMRHLTKATEDCSKMMRQKRRERLVGLDSNPADSRRECTRASLRDHEQRLNRFDRNIELSTHFAESCFVSRMLDSPVF